MNQWMIETKGLNDPSIIERGHRNLIGNGQFGYRGTLTEHRKDKQVALNINNLYDGVEGKWRESVNAPNPLFQKFVVNGEAIDEAWNVVFHVEKLHMDTAIHKRITQYEKNNTIITLESERFLSMESLNTLAMRTRLKANKSMDITVLTATDTDVWELNGPHFSHFEKMHNNNKRIVKGTTQEINHTIRVSVSHTLGMSNTYNEDGLFGEQSSIQLKKDVTSSFDTIASIDINTSEYPLNTASFDELLSAHINVWTRLWDKSDVKIEGDPNAQRALRYSIYHMLILTPPQDASIPARGLSGQVYKGAVFWDTEIFLFPFFLQTNPIAARHLLNYRIKTLAGAKKKAKAYGYSGAFYAWESHADGRDACSDFNITDVFTGRPVRTYFKDKQIHISADIAHAMWQYYDYTQDLSILLRGGTEVIIEAARFYMSRMHLNVETNEYVWLDVVGPDEYHERVHNNAFTNTMVKKTFEYALKVHALIKEQHPCLLDTIFDDADKRLLTDIENVLHTIKIHRPDQSGLIEQFDGYFSLEDATPDMLKKRLKHPNEYWGTSHGVAFPTQVIKQADVVAMLALFPDDYPFKTKKRNFEYYEPRTEHGSTLSASMYGLLACETGDLDYAYKYFMKTATTDLHGGSKQYAGKTYIGGTHPASSGGAYMLAVHGFAGLSFNHEKGTISAYPRLPDSIEKLAFKITYRDELYKVTITQDDYTIKRERDTQ